MALGKLFIISAPSGAGKTSLVKAVLKKLSKKYRLKRTVTYTTRQPRQGEIDGKHYYFISLDEFKQKIKQGFFIEWSTWYDHYYGSPVTTLQAVEKGTSYIMILDRAGAKDALKVYPAAILIWIEPPSLKELEKRLKKRGDTQSSIESRLRKAEVEIQQEKESRLYQYHIINDDFNYTVTELTTLFEKVLRS